MKALVIVVDSLHLGYLGCYGNQWIETPALDSLAGESVVFDQHIADRPDPEGAWHAWRTGCYDFQKALPAAAGPGDLLHLLKRHGIETHLLLDSEPRGTDVRSGWSEIHWSESREDVFNGAYGILDELGTRDNWLAWLELSSLLPPWRLADDTALLYFAADETNEGDDETKREPEPLTPLLSPEGSIEPDDDATFSRLQRTYAAAVTELDAGLGSLLEELAKSGALDDALIVITADRGLPLGEHGFVGYGHPWLHEELVHVPLMVRVPKNAVPSGRVLTPTQPIDLMPTLLEGFGLTPPSVHGHSLWPLMRGEKRGVRDRAVSLLRVGNTTEGSLRTGQWCFILPLGTGSETTTRAPQLYVKPDDRWEVNNVLQHHTDLADELEKSLRDLIGPAQTIEQTSTVLEGV
jgi:arylsulfatase A-like enzyme